MFKRFFSLLRRRRLDEELDAEVDFHLDMLAEEHMRRGLDAGQARAAARREFGGVVQMQEVYRERRGVPLIETVLQDLRYGIRLLRKSPGFTAAAVLSLALGIGANTALFSVFNALVLRSMPVARPSELVAIRKTNGPPYLGSFSYPFYKQVAARTDLFSGVLAASAPAKARLGYHAGQVDFAFFEFVSGNYFELLGLNPAAGRFFTEAEELPAGAHPVAVISHEFWSARLAMDPNVAGRRLELDGKPYVIVGVAPAGFRGLDAEHRAEVWVPLGMSGEKDITAAHFNWLRVVGRRQPGVKPERIAATLDAMHRQDVLATRGAKSPWRKVELEMRVRAQSGAGGISSLRDSFREPLAILMGLVALLLLITCANVANLLLARGAARRREMALRMAIGASRPRILRQSITETLLLAAGGGTLGLAIAILGSRALAGLLPSGENTAPLDVRPDLNVLFFTGVVSLAVVVLVGLIPAWRSTRVDAAPSLKEGGGAGGAGHRLGPGRTLVVVQVAMCAVLLAGAGLYIRTLIGLRLLDPGFREENVLTFWIDLPKHYKNDQSAPIYRALVERAGTLPGVRSASFAAPGPFLSGRASATVTVDTPDGPKQAYVDWQTVTPGYFETLGATLLRGRRLDAHDKLAAVVNEAFVREVLRGVDPVGRHIVSGEPIPIVGVIRDMRHHGLREKVPPTAYLPAEGLKFSSDFVSFQVRAAMRPDALIESVRRELRAIDSAVALTDPRTLEARVDESLLRERLLAALSAGFGALAIALASVGLYGLLSYAVSRRSKEIGIRIALGAERGRVLRGVMGDALALVALGVAIGIPVAFSAAGVTASLLYGVTPGDPSTYSAAAAVLFAVGVLAAWAPARRASSVSPIDALRHE